MEGRRQSTKVKEAKLLTTGCWQAYPQQEAFNFQPPQLLELLTSMDRPTSVVLDPQNHQAARKKGSQH